MKLFISVEVVPNLHLCVLSSKYDKEIHTLAFLLRKSVLPAHLGSKYVARASRWLDQLHLKSGNRETASQALAKSNKICPPAPLRLTN